MYQIDLSLQVLPKSLNHNLKWGGKWEKVKANKAWDNLIYLEVCKRLPPQPLKKARIRIVRHFYRTLDYDGLVGSLKPVVDALVTAGVIADDSWNVLGAWEVDQVFRPKKDGPLLEIQVIEQTVA